MEFKNDFVNHCRKGRRGCLNRALTILLCLLMLAAAVCGCSGTVSGEPGSVPEPSGEQTEPAGGGPAGPEEDEEDEVEKEHKEGEPVTEEDEQVDEQLISEEEGTAEVDAPEEEDPEEIVEGGITIRTVGNGSHDNIEWVKDTLIKISSGDTEELHLEEYSGNQWIGNDVRDILYRDGDFLYVVYELSPLMSQFYGTTAYSTDGGKTWYVNQLHHLYGWDGFYVLDRRIVEKDFFEGMCYVHDPHISFDYGVSCSQSIYSKSVYHILSLPGINESGISVYGEVYSVDREKNRISVRWVMGKYRENAVPVLEKDVNYDTLEDMDERDLSGLAAFADRYRETGFLFPDSSTVLLDPEEVKEHYERELVFSAPEYVVKEIDLAIYEIYARYGMDFRGTVYDEYFLEKSWYYQDWLQEEDSVQLNEIEKANIELLKSIRKDIESSGSGED